MKLTFAAAILFPATSVLAMSGYGYILIDKGDTKKEGDIDLNLLPVL